MTQFLLTLTYAGDFRIDYFDCGWVIVWRFILFYDRVVCFLTVEQRWQPHGQLRDKHNSH